MTMSTTSTADGLNSRLARLLGIGSWASCGLIAAGMALRMSGVSARSVADHLVSAGIVLLIALPTLRVALMAVWFLLRRDRDFALIAALVLVIIVASTLLGAGAA
jgi:cytochrome bd-type quinol oxidase subunit 2